MKKDQIKLSDGDRVLFGDVSPVHGRGRTAKRDHLSGLVLTIRLLGKRMNGQLTITEMAVMITLGAIVALPMQTPDRGILIAVLVLFCAFVFQRGINLISWKSEKFERLTQGELSILVRDGVLQIPELLRVRISRQQLFSLLRNRNIFNLGKVSRVYLEACGVYSVY